MKQRLKAAAAAAETWQQRSLARRQKSRKQQPHSRGKSFGGSPGGYFSPSSAVSPHSPSRRSSFSPDADAAAGGGSGASVSSSVFHTGANRLHHGLAVAPPPFPQVRSPHRTHRDEYLDIGHGVVMTFRIIEGDHLTLSTHLLTACHYILST